VAPDPRRGHKLAITLKRRTRAEILHGGAVAPSGAVLRPAIPISSRRSFQPSATPAPARPVRSSLAALSPVLPSLRDGLRPAFPGPGTRH
jgi:hypothetical protein